MYVDTIEIKVLAMRRTRTSMLQVQRPDYVAQQEKIKSFLEEVKLLEILKQVEENRLHHQMIETFIKSTEEQITDVQDMLGLFRGEFEQSSIEVQNSKIETRQVKDELDNLKMFTRTSIQELNGRLDELILASSQMDYKEIGSNVQLVLDQYMTAKYGAIAESDDEDDEMVDADEDDVMDEDEEEEEEEPEDPEEIEQEPETQQTQIVEISEPVNEATEVGNEKVEQFKEIYSNHPQVTIDEQGNIKYSLAKDILTIEKIWEEFHNGVNGGPPIQMLESIFQTRWRLRNENSTWLRRKKIYKAINFAITNLNYDAKQTIDELESIRYDETGKKRPMYWLYEHIPSKFKQGL